MVTPHGRVSVNTNGTFTYWPSSGFRGNDTFTYQITDGRATSASATVTMIVGQPPVAADFSFTMHGGTMLYAGSLAVLNGDTGGVVHLSGPAPAGLTLNSDGSFSFYAPAGGPNHNVSFQYFITNPDGTSGIGWVNIEVIAGGFLPPPGKIISQPPATPPPG
jgi:hypothetical protein